MPPHQVPLGPGSSQVCTQGAVAPLKGHLGPLAPYGHGPTAPVLKMPPGGTGRGIVYSIMRIHARAASGRDSPPGKPGLTSKLRSRAAPTSVSKPIELASGSLHCGTAERSVRAQQPIYEGFISWVLRI